VIEDMPVLFSVDVNRQLLHAMYICFVDLLVIVFE